MADGCLGSVQVLCKLDTPRDLVSASLACKQLNRATHAEKIWRDLYDRHFLTPSPRAGLKLSQWANKAAVCHSSPEEALFRYALLFNAQSRQHVADQSSTSY